VHAIWCILSYLYMEHWQLTIIQCIQVLFRFGCILPIIVIGTGILQWATQWKWWDHLESLLIFVNDQQQFQLWRSSWNSMISSCRSMIEKKKTKRIEKLLVPPWRRNSRGHLSITNFHLLHMRNLNVCIFFLKTSLVTDLGTYNISSYW